MNNASCDTVYEAFKLAAKKAPEMGVAAMAVSLCSSACCINVYKKNMMINSFDGVFAKNADED